MSTPTTRAPLALARRARARLAELADATAAARGRRFFKKHDEVSLYGVKASDVRRLERDLYQDIRGVWTVRDAMAFCEAMSRSRRIEAKTIGVLVLARYRRELPPGLLGRARRWILEGRFPNWATIDALAPMILTPLVASHPSLIPRIRRWTRSPNIWLRRAAIVTFVPLARGGQRLDVAYALVRSVDADDADLIQKACGWLLREAGTHDRPRLERFLIASGHRLSRTTVRYAIGRFPERRRRHLLAATRASRR